MFGELKRLCDLLYCTWISLDFCHYLFIQQLLLTPKTQFCVFIFGESFRHPTRVGFWCVLMEEHFAGSFRLTTMVFFSYRAGPDGKQHADRSERQLPHPRCWLVHVGQGGAGLWRWLRPGAGDGHEVCQLPHGRTRPEWWAWGRRTGQELKILTGWGEKWIGDISWDFNLFSFFNLIHVNFLLLYIHFKLLYFNFDHYDFIRVVRIK